MTQKLQCPHCKTMTIERRPEIQVSYEQWICTGCGELKSLCPGCNQGWVNHVSIKADRDELYACDECETTWLQLSDIGKVTPQNFVDIMRGKGLKGLWSEIEIIRDKAVG